MSRTMLWTCLTHVQIMSEHMHKCMHKCMHGCKQTSMHACSLHTYRHKDKQKDRNTDIQKDRTKDTKSDIETKQKTEILKTQMAKEQKICTQIYVGRHHTEVQHNNKSHAWGFTREYVTFAVRHETTFILKRIKKYNDIFKMYFWSRVAHLSFCHVKS